MARAPMAPAAAVAGGDDAPTDAGIGAGQPMGDDGGDDASVVLTVLKGPDGSYVLVKGDESEDDEGDEGESADDDAAGAGGGAAGGMGGGAGMGGGEDAGQHYTSIGALMKGIMDMLNEDAAGGGAGGGGAADQFAAGFNDQAGPTPKAA